MSGSMVWWSSGSGSSTTPRRCSTWSRRRSWRRRRARSPGRSRKTRARSFRPSSRTIEARRRPMGAVLGNDILIATLWWIPVAVAFVVCIVAVGLLQNILVVARNIDANVHTIWTVGKQIANNTVELWLLGKTVGLVKDIRVAAPQINDTAQAIARHAQECTHCPACVSPGGYTAFD